MDYSDGSEYTWNMTQKPGPRPADWPQCYIIATQASSKAVQPIDPIEPSESLSPDRCVFNAHQNPQEPKK